MKARLLIACALLGACGGRRLQGAGGPSPAASSVVVIPMGDVDKLFGSLSYLIDPMTESCSMLVQRAESDMMVPVDCAKLAAHLPQAAAAITWLAPATPAVAPVAPVTP